MGLDNRHSSKNYFSSKILFYEPYFCEIYKKLTFLIYSKIAYFRCLPNGGMHLHHPKLVLRKTNPTFSLRDGGVKKKGKNKQSTRNVLLLGRPLWALFLICPVKRQPVHAYAKTIELMSLWGVNFNSRTGMSRCCVSGQFGHTMVHRLVLQRWRRISRSKLQLAFVVNNCFPLLTERLNVSSVQR